ncbi:MAG: DUF1848 domain-containing protein [Ignavibacteriae bacterium]|nr:DUF1848 domain-containing protein [Ignavibacteriota bacterium]NOG99879.1 DUF1848 domain-containing protein [Ignavibacteriota bacterium]
MIISASRRTDIPAYYSKWFYNRIKEGYCTVPNPFNSKQISVIDLKPEAVDAIIFWTRNPRPLFNYLNEIDNLGYKYYFQFTINNFPKHYEPNNPSLENALKTFIELSKRIGSGKTIWRYDPILLTDDLTEEYHNNNFQNISNHLKGYSKRVVISIIDDYRKTLRRLQKLDTNYTPNQEEHSDIERLLKNIVDIATQNNMEVQSCAESKNYSYLGIKPGKCIDDDILKNELKIDLLYKKDKTQRLACGCMISRDIGMNDTCLMGCEYCYATTSHKAALNNKQKHDSCFSSIVKHELPEAILEKIKELQRNRETELDLFSNR